MFPKSGIEVALPNVAAIPEEAQAHPGMWVQLVWDPPWCQELGVNPDLCRFIISIKSLPRLSLPKLWVKSPRSC